MNHKSIANLNQDQLQKLQQRKADRNAARAMQFEQAMFDSRSRYLILVLTLGYRPERRHEITLDLLREHRNRLFNNRRCNELLQCINGHVWKIEEGQNSGGLHFHVVIFYSGDHRADILIAKRIGEYWVDVVTQGMGAYWNSNAAKDAHAEFGHGIGTGPINRNDDTKREALRQNLRYLAKDDQHVETRTNRHSRMFGTSQSPRK